jgi:uncharacterized DUF497 family protein
LGSYGQLRFEWDDAKAARNLRKHGVSFETAVLVFADTFAVTEQDRIENGEYRWQTLGVAGGLLVLMVAHADRDDDGIEVVRIFSARQATPRERRKYGQNRQI